MFKTCVLSCLGDWQANIITTSPLRSVGKKKLSTKEYIASISDWASKDMSVSGIYASITIAQAILEGGAGNSDLAAIYHNHFGIKGIGGACDNSDSGTTKKNPTKNTVWDGTSVCACGPDGCYWYRAYKNIGESLADHSRNFWVTKSYGRNGVLECVQNDLGPEEQIKRIKAAGYAEDAKYVSKIMNVIKAYNLEQYDKGSYNGTVPQYSSSSSNDSNNSINNNAPNYYTSGGYLELYRMSLLEDTINIQVEKQEIYDDILEEAKEFGTTFGQEQVTENQYGDIIDTTRGDYTNWKQSGAPWSHITIGNTSKTISKIGCAATSVAIQIARSGTRVIIDNFNPGTFVQALNRAGGFTAAGNIYWASASVVAPNFKFDKQVNISGLGKQEKLNRIRSLINEGCYLIMSVKNSGHWVAVTGVTNDNVAILDPGAKNRFFAWPVYSVEGTQRLTCYKKLD